MRQFEHLHYVDAIARAGSIRKAAETLAITSTALNRRLLALEDELGVAIFERLPRGVRLSTGGELVTHHIRSQAAEFDRLKSQLDYLSGERRGHVAIACSQALVPYFLPEQIAEYRTPHPRVTFSVLVRDRAAAEQALVEHSVDLALVFEPVRMSEIQVLATARQAVHAVMAPDHPLAAMPVLRLSACAQYPMAFPTASYGVRYLLDMALRRAGRAVRPAIESDSFEFLRRYPARERLVGFQIPVGLPADDGTDGITSRPLDARDVQEGMLYLCQLRGRTLPVAAAKFASQLERVLAGRFG